MPRDEWLRENNRIKYGTPGRRDRHNAHAKRITINYEARGLTAVLNTVVWFGKWNGTKVKDVPLSYWKWLATQHPGNDGGQMDQFNSFIAEYVCNRHRMAKGCTERRHLEPRPIQVQRQG